MDFIKLLIRFIPQYKCRIISYVVLNFLCSICSVFSFIAIIPLIQIIFKITDHSYKYIESDGISSFSDLMGLTKNNVIYFLQERIVVDGESSVLISIGLFIITMSFLFNVISYFAYWVRIPIRTGISRDLRKDAFDKICHMPINAFTNENRGDFVSRMTNDVEEVENGIGTTMDMFIKDPIQAIVYLITMVGISPSLSLYAICMILGVCLFVIFLGRTMQKISLEAQSNRGKILSSFEQTLGILPIIKSFRTTSQFLQKFDILNKRSQNIFNKQNRFYSLAWPSTDFLITIILVFMLCIGGCLILSGKSDMNPAVFIGFLGVFFSTIPPIRNIMKCTFGIRKAMASVARLNKILSVENEHTNEIISTNLGNPIIEFQNVSFKYNNSYVLKDISFKIKHGQKVAFLGSTGSGKSTLTYLMNLFYDNYEGQIFISGIDVKLLGLDTVRGLYSYIPQNPMLLNDTVANNITIYNPEYTMDDIVCASKKAYIHNFVESMQNGYNTIVGDRGCSFSGGQQQCIAIARAMLKKAPITIIDEGTSALDPELETKIMNELYKINNEKTMIIISHKISTVLNVDYIYILDEGKVIDQGTPKELYSKEGFFRSMAKIQNFTL